MRSTGREHAGSVKQAGGNNRRKWRASGSCDRGAIRNSTSDCANINGAHGQRHAIPPRLTARCASTRLSPSQCPISHTVQSLTVSSLPHCPVSHTAQSLTVFSLPHSPVSHTAQSLTILSLMLLVLVIVATINAASVMACLFYTGRHLLTSLGKVTGVAYMEHCVAGTINLTKQDAARGRVCSAAFRAVALKSEKDKLVQATGNWDPAHHCPSTSLCSYTIIPVPHYASISPFLYLIVLLSDCASISLFLYLTVLLPHCPSISLCLCLTVPLSHCACI